ncbi:flagellar FliJ protein [Aneurinibacillus soli]|uniref:Flagellar FliJ protein n=1 Tax=Aneurinibacillus soli TaxID=1500254 RepID=A0A0U5B7T5_9BACL|nr:flagellar export protein FliJ [Aneurinibacillus soli]PYE63398.1 flagellar FliJ protein [Aneurinibacillus soli]BAU27670.1 Flagellar FliJ protein [Aneurinibacillus soli]
MSFVYSFQKILDVKGKEKEQAEMSYSHSVQALRIKEQKLTHLEQNKQEMEQKLQQESQISLAELRSGYEYIGHLQRMIIEAACTKQQAEKEVESKQELLTERVMDEKVWLKLKENAYEQYRELQKQTEQRELDEIAVARYFRQKVNSV